MRFEPIPCSWTSVEVMDADTGQVHRRMALVPNKRWAKIAAKQFREGEEHPMVVLEPRTRASHSHFFAVLNEGFQQLPEDIAPRFPTPEHLRHWLLIEAGWCTEAEYDASDWGIKSEREFGKWSQNMAVILRKNSPFCRIYPSYPKLIVRDAMSQSAGAMDSHTFEASKRAVLDMLSGLIGVRTSELQKNAGRSA